MSLYGFIARGDFAFVEKLLRDDPSLASKLSGKRQVYPIHYAVCHGRDLIAELILQTDASQVDVLDSKGRTPLHLLMEDPYSVIADDLRAKLTALLKRFNSKAMTILDKTGNSPLHFAAARNRISFLEAVGFMDSCPDSIFEGNLNQMTPFHLAVANRHREAMLFLEEKSGGDAAFATRSSTGSTLLHSIVDAPLSFFQEVHERSKEQVEAVDDLGRTPLVYALNYGHREVASYLFDHGAIVHEHMLTSKGVETLSRIDTTTLINPAKRSRT